MEDLVDDAGEVLDAVIERVADGPAPQVGQAQAQHKSQNHGGQGVQQRGDGQAEVAVQGVAGGGGNLLQGPLAHEAGEQGGGHQVGGGAENQGGSVGQSHRDEQQLARAALQIGNAHGDVGQDHQGNDELKERAEDAGGGDDDPAEPDREELSDQDTQDDCDDQFWKKTQFERFLFHLLKHPLK